MATSPKPIIRHLHLRSPSTYAHALHIQDILIRRLLTYKAALSLTSSHGSSPTDQVAELPPATILTFSPLPTYTTGRRDIGTLISEEQRSILEEPLEETFSAAVRRKRSMFGREVDGLYQAVVHTGTETLTPAIHQSSRGGQITFHGPGQLVIWPVFSLTRPASFPQSSPSESSVACSSSDLPQSCSNSTASPSRSSASSSSSPSTSTATNLKAPYPLTPRCYVSLLESTTIATLQKYNIAGIRTANPGVWLDDDNKIAALGVHLRRNVTSFGVGLNVCTDARWWDRIVACGLVGKGVKSMEEIWTDRRIEERENGTSVSGAKRLEIRRGGSPENVGRIWVEKFASAVGARVEQIEEATLELEKG